LLIQKKEKIRHIELSSLKREETSWSGMSSKKICLNRPLMDPSLNKHATQKFKQLNEMQID
jgi:hypothetical protein